MEDYEIVLKPIYLSKKDILNKMPYLKTERDENYSQITKNQNQHPLPNKYKNLGKKNLTYQNFLDYTYDYNRINEYKIRMPDHLKIKQKYKLLLQNESNPFYQKKAHKKVTPLLITGLNTQSNKSYNKYNNIFSVSQKSCDNSEVKTKYSSNKYIKSNIFNYNSSNKNDIIFPSSEISKSNIHFHKDIGKFTKNENKDEGLKAFVLKSKIILKEKIIKQELKDKLNYHYELHTEGINALNQKKERLYKNLKLFDIFDKVYVHHIRDLIKEEAYERHLYNKSKQIKINLENDITILLKKIDRLKNELKRFDVIKKFFKSTAVGQEVISDKEKKESVINDNEENNSKDKNMVVTNKKMNDFKKNLLISVNTKMLTYRHRLALEQNKSPKKSMYQKHISLKTPPLNLEKNNIINENNTKEKQEKIIKKKNKDLSNRRKSKRKSSMLVHQRQYEHMFTDKENLILRYIGVQNKRQNELLEDKKILEEIEKSNINKNKYINEMIIKKEEKLSLLKEENKNLLLKFDKIPKRIIKKISSNNILEEKMIKILLNIEKQINVQKILKVKNLSFMLELDPEEFLERFRSKKIIFLIKAIELITTYLIAKKNKYLSEPKLKEALRNFLFKLENDKKLRMNKINKDILKKQLEEKKAKASERATRIRFYSYRKFDLGHYKNKRHKQLKEKINNKTVADNQYDQWLLYD